MDFDKTNNNFIVKREIVENKAWTGSDRTLFHSIYRVFPRNYCAIAMTMLNKTCKEVYDFAMSELLNLPDKPLRNCQLMKSPPKRSSRSWLSYAQNFQKKKEKKSGKIYNYTPCDHGDKPCDKSCPCIKSLNYCEKFCKCSVNCQNRYPGCDCKGQCNKKQCLCYAAHRECDPDLCRTCKAGNPDINEVSCKNINIQRGIHMHLLIAPSDVAGWGCFLKDGAKKNDFISEYRGEVITDAEADRRGKIYDKRKCSYLFKLNEEYSIDAINVGNKIRFANHSSKRPNCYPRVMMVNGDHRIGIYAKKNIDPGSELLLDYCYTSTERLKFTPIEKK